MNSHQDEQLKLAVNERQCENQMREFEIKFNIDHSIEVMKNILLEISKIQSQLCHENCSLSYCQYDEQSSTCELIVQLLRVEARVYECIGSIYLSLSLSNQSLLALQKSSDIMQQVYQLYSLNNISYNTKDFKLMARVSIKISVALFLQSKRKASYILLIDVHTFLKQNNLLESEEEALLYLNLGNFYRFIFQDELSEICYSRCICLREKIQGKRSPAVYDTKQELAKLYIESGKISLAEKLLNEVINFKQEFYGEFSPSTSVAYLYRATLQFVVNGNIDDSEQDVLKSISINTLFFGEINKYNAECYLLLGKILAKKQPNSSVQVTINKQQSHPYSYTSDKQSVESSFSSQSNSPSKQPYSQLSSSNSLSSLDQQISTFINLQQLKLNKQSLSLDNSEAIYTQTPKDLYKNISQLQKVEEDLNLDAFLPYFNKAIYILKIIFGEQNGTVGVAYNATGKILQSLKYYEKALTYFNESIRIFNIRGSQNDFNICEYYALKNAADCNMQLGRLKTAHLQYQQILEVKEKLNVMFSDFKENEQIPNQQKNKFTKDINYTQINSPQITIEDEHKKLFVPPIDINSQQIMQLLNESKTED